MAVCSASPKHWRTELVDWPTLEHAYGRADDIPELLAQLSPDPHAPVWHALWSRLYHQYTVYSASYAALPYLADAAAAWAPAARATPLILAGAIVGARGGETDPATVERLLSLALETLAAPVPGRPEFIYMLQTALAFQGDTLWGNDGLSGLVDGEVQGLCPACGQFMLFAVDDDRLTVTPGDCAPGPNVKQVPVEPAPLEDMEGAGRWMHETATQGGQPELARWIQHLFGTSKCSGCGQEFALPEAVARLRTGPGW